MRVPRIYLPTALTVGAPVPLNEAAFNHAIRVLRLKPGDPLIVFNGEGGEYRAILKNVTRREAAARVDEFVPREAESPMEITLAQGISKGERMDYTLQKAVELGVSVIMPLFTERSVVNLSRERLDKRLQHWRGVVIGACEQSGRNRLPSVLAPLELRTWLQGKLELGLRLVLDPMAEQGLTSLAPPGRTITLLIGPEGGLSPEEIALTEMTGFSRIRLGPRVMRTETAGIAALAAVQVLWGDLG